MLGIAGIWFHTPMGELDTLSAQPLGTCPSHLLRWRAELAQPKLFLEKNYGKRIFKVSRKSHQR